MFPSIPMVERGVEARLPADRGEVNKMQRQV